jgi:pilus assembly protein CpaF
MSFQDTVNFARNLVVKGQADSAAAIQGAVDMAHEGLPLDANSENETRIELRNHLLGFGALQPLIDDESIEEIWINSPDEVFVARSGISESLNLKISPDQLRIIVEKMLRYSGRRLDRSNPFVDAALPDGSRLHVAIPEITRKYWSLNIRKFPKRLISLNDLVSLGSLTPFWAEILREMILAKKNFLVSGATQSGKTTLLSALLNEVPMRQRIVSVEETFELKIDNSDWVAMQTRQPNLEGVGEVTLRRLVKESLRMRPDRLVVGEVREAEAMDLLIALNSGLPGACTIHANSAREAISKLCTLPLLAGQNISSAFVQPAVGDCINTVIHCEIDAQGKRSIGEVLEVHWNSLEQRIEFEEVPKVALA